MTELEKLVAKACKLQQRLANQPERRLAAAAFVHKALTIADCEEERLDALETKLDPDEQVFVRRIVRLIGDGMLKEPFRDLKRLGAYAGPITGKRLFALQALAVRVATRKHPNAFGHVADFASYDSQVQKLQDELVETLEAMKAAVTGADLIFDQNNVSLDERDRGLAQVKFRAWPDVVMSEKDWPHRLLSAEQQRMAA